MAPRYGEILSLYKQMLRESKKFPSYMYRTYAVRRIRNGFREHINETDKQKIDDLIAFAKSNLEIIKRQVIIGQMYKDKDLVIEHYSKSNQSNQGV